MRALLTIATAVFALAACGQPAPAATATTTPVSSERRSPPREAVKPPREHGSTVANVQTAARGDLEIVVNAPERSGEILDPRLVPIEIEVTNREDHAVSIHPAFVETEVYSGAQRIEGCTMRKPLALPLFLEAGQTLTTEASLPCALPEPGTFSIVAAVVVGEADLSATLGPNDVVHTATARLVVDEELASVGSPTMPIARVNPSGYAFPSSTSADVLGPTEGPPPA